MTRFLLFAAVSLGYSAVATAAPAQRILPYVEGEVIVKLKPQAPEYAVRAKRDLGFTTKARFMDGRVELLQLPAVTTVARALPLLRSDPAVEYAEPNFRRFPLRTPPNDPLFPDQWGLHSTGQPNFRTSDPALASIPGADMDMLAAWDPDGDGQFDRTGNGSVTVAIIDDAVETDHPDLAGNIVAGYDFANRDSNPNPDPGSDQTHGTMVAGCVGAQGNNGIGVAGTAWNVKLMPLKFAFNTSSFLAAMDFARQRGAKIINASFGGPGFSRSEVDALETLAENDILLVAAAGNSDSNTDIAQLNYPANYPAENVIAVAATNRQDQIASFSQYGPTTVDIAAPGIQVVTTNINHSYRSAPGVDGTSFAAPYVAGIAALLRMHRPTAGYREIKARLIEGAEPADNVNLRTASGRVNAARSLDLQERPALVIRGIQWADANQALDAGETTSVDVTVFNLWRRATEVVGTLSADNGVTTQTGAVSFGTIASGSSVTRRFQVTVPADVADHRYVAFSLALQSPDYQATRRFIAEIGDLREQPVTQSFASRGTNIYDEFHAWHHDFAALPPGHNRLVIEAASDTDVDLLVKRGAPPRYDITVGVDPETGAGVFCTSGTTFNCQDPDTHVSAAPQGNERVIIEDPVPGTYHIVVVNFAQAREGATYTLRAYTSDGAVTDEQPLPSPVGSGDAAGQGRSDGGGGGGPMLLSTVLALLLIRRFAPRA